MANGIVNKALDQAAKDHPGLAKALRRIPPSSITPVAGDDRGEWRVTILVSNGDGVRTLYYRVDKIYRFFLAQEVTA